jgi:hypothetical protein
VGILEALEREDRLTVGVLTAGLSGRVRHWGVVSVKQEIVQLTLNPGPSITHASRTHGLRRSELSVQAGSAHKRGI